MQTQQDILPKKEKIKIGDFLVIRFLDHAMQSDVQCIESLTPVECIVCGFLQKRTKTCYIIQTWDCLDDDEETRLYNSNFFTIVKSTIISIDKAVKFVKIK